MIRRFLTPRWITISLLTVVIVVLFGLFGFWQLSRWDDRGTTVRPPDARPVAPLSELVSPDQPLAGGSIGRQTAATGRFDPANQILVADRELGGRPGYWVVSALRPEGTNPAGATALVVRGWVPTAEDPALATPAGPVTVTGRVYASEDPPPVGTADENPLPPRQYREVNTAELTGAFPYRLLDGFVLASEVRVGDASTGAPTAPPPAPAIVPAPPELVDSGGGLRNLAYAFQWWLFAIAVLYFFSKLVRDDFAPEKDEPTQERGDPDREPTSAGRPEPAPGQRAATEPDAGAAEEEDPELAAYNRYLAGLHARSGRG